MVADDAVTGRPRLTRGAGRQQRVAHRPADQVHLETGRGEALTELDEHGGDLDELAHRLLHRWGDQGGLGRARGRWGTTRRLGNHDGRG